MGDQERINSIKPINNNQSYSTSNKQDVNQETPSYSFGSVFSNPTRVPQAVYASESCPVADFTAGLNGLNFGSVFNNNTFNGYNTPYNNSYDGYNNGGMNDSLNSYGSPYMYGIDPMDMAAMRSQQKEIINNYSRPSTEVTEVGADLGKINALLSGRTRESEKIHLITAELKAALAEGDEDHTEMLLKGLSPHQIAAVEILYGQDGDPTQLRKDIRDNFENFFNVTDASEKEMFNILNKAAMVSPYNASLALKEAMDGAGTDENTVKTVINGSSKEFLYEANKQYAQIFGTTIASDVKNDFNWFWGGPEDQLVNKLASCYEY